MKEDKEEKEKDKEEKNKYSGGSSASSSFSLESSEFSLSSYFDHQLVYGKQHQTLFDSKSVKQLVSHLINRSNQLNGDTESLLRTSIPQLKEQRLLEKEIHRVLLSHKANYSSLHISLSQSLEELRNISNRLLSLGEEWSGVERNLIYLQLVEKCEEVSDSAKQEAENNPQQAGHSILTLTRLYFQIKQSAWRTHHLTHILHNRLIYLLSLVKSHLFSSYSLTLTSINWPQTQQKLIKIEDPILIKQLAELTETIVLLQAEEEKLKESELPIDISNVSPSNAPPLPLHPLWLIQLLVSPLLKRFHYHFGPTSTKPTNIITKPEYYLSYIKQLIQNHILFLQKYIQPIVTRSAPFSTSFDIVALFIHDLLVCIREKFQSDTNRLISDEKLFRHTVDEYLIFEAQLRMEFPYPEPYPGILIILIEPPSIFEYWVGVEKSWVNLKLKEITEMEDKWKMLNEETKLEEQEINEETLPSSIFLATSGSHSLLSLINSVTDRYRLLPLLSARLRFLQDIQFQLLDIYRDECSNASRSSLKEWERRKGRTDWKEWSGVMNSVVYVESVMKEWSDDPLFIELKYYQSNPQLFDSHTTPFQLAEQITISSSQSNQKNGIDSRFLLEGSLFDPLLLSYTELRTEMVAELSEVILAHFHRLSKQYRSIGHHWTVGDDDEEEEKEEEEDSEGGQISPMLADCILFVKTLLIDFSLHLSTFAFTYISEHLATQMDRYFYFEIVQSKWFSPRGIIRLGKELKIVQSQFESYRANQSQQFHLSGEALMILSLPVSAAGKLYSFLLSLPYLSASVMERAVLLKKNWQVHHLSGEDLKNLLEHRIDADYLPSEDKEKNTKSQLGESEREILANSDIKESNNSNINGNINSSPPKSSSARPHMNVSGVNSHPVPSELSSSLNQISFASRPSRLSRFSAGGSSVLSSAYSFTKLLARPIYAHVTAKHEKKSNPIEINIQRNEKQKEEKEGEEQEEEEDEEAEEKGKSNDFSMNNDVPANRSSDLEKVNNETVDEMGLDDWEWGESGQKIKNEPSEMGNQEENDEIGQQSSTGQNSNPTQLNLQLQTQTEGWDIN